MGESREINRSKSQKCFQQHQGEADAEYSSAAGQDGRLDQNLPDDVRGFGAEGYPDAKLVAPRESTCEQKSRDVRAGNQQHRRDRAEEQVQGLSKIAANVVEQWPNVDAVLLRRPTHGNGFAGLPGHALRKDNIGIRFRQVADLEQQGRQRPGPPPVPQGLGSDRAVSDRASLACCTTGS